MTRLGQMLYDDGLKEGFSKGREQEARRNAALTARLLEENRLEDFKKTTEDKDYREQLMKEFGID